MGMTSNNLCDSCTNIGCGFQSGIVRTECAFYMPPHIEPDNCGNYVAMQPTVEAIPKADYEARLKVDLEAILTDMRLEFEEELNCGAYCDECQKSCEDIPAKWFIDFIQEKINVLKENKDE